MPCLKLMRPVFELKSSSLSFLADKNSVMDILLKLFPSLTERKEDRKKKKSEKEKAMG